MVKGGFMMCFFFCLLGAFGIGFGYSYNGVVGMCACGAIWSGVGSFAFLMAKINRTKPVWRTAYERW